MAADSTRGDSGCEEKAVAKMEQSRVGRLCRVGVPLGFVTCPKHIAVRKCNYRAEMTALNVAGFAGLVVGNVPKRSKVLSVAMSRSATTKSRAYNPACCSIGLA